MAIVLGGTVREHQHQGRRRLTPDARSLSLLRCSAVLWSEPCGGEARARRERSSTSRARGRAVSHRKRLAARAVPVGGNRETTPSHVRAHRDTAPCDTGRRVHVHARKLQDRFHHVTVAWRCHTRLTHNSQGTRGAATRILHPKNQPPTARRAARDDAANASAPAETAPRSPARPRGDCRRLVSLLEWYPRPDTVMAFTV